MRQRKRIMKRFLRQILLLCGLFLRQVWRLRKVLTLSSLFLLLLLRSFMGYQSDKSAVDYRAPPRMLEPYICTGCEAVTSCNANRTVINGMRNFPEARVDIKKVTTEKVLVIVETVSSPMSQEIGEVLSALKIPFNLEPLGKDLSFLNRRIGIRDRFSLVIIENYYKYLNDELDRKSLDKYCVDYSVGIVGFLLSRPAQKLVRATVRGGSGLILYQNQKVRNLRFHPLSSVPFISKPGPILREPENSQANWIVFDESGAREGSFEPVLQADVNDSYTKSSKNSVETYSPVILDLGVSDGIRRILFGQNLREWLIKLCFVDAIKRLTDGLHAVPLDRYIQIDIDDIFVGATGSRMIAADVRALIDFQTRLRQSIPRFTLNLGFSGNYFRRGNDLEDKGDEMLIDLASEFVWFPHFWTHLQPQLYPSKNRLSAIFSDMHMNREFSQKHKLPVFYNYSVSPHHAGVYPVYEPLYEAWSRVWGIRVTCTEEYPHLKPASKRRGFIHRNIMVLPRQTCGLYTHNHLLDSYPGGAEALKKNIEGGDLFFSVVFNPLALFMTHQQNYAHDRLAITTFERLVSFVKCWTNLKLKWMEPLKIGAAYFHQFPDERKPIWRNPCSDARHVDLLPPEFDCNKLRLPNLVVLGPQKTGSTALYEFLKLHPAVVSNLESRETFEEVQFFGGKNYEKGLDWYLNQFPHGSENASVLFEKSATYFDNEDAARQIEALLPDAKLIVILNDPAKRAYSWYQHMRAHNNSLAMRHSFEEVLMAKEGDGKLWKLRHRCLNPGRYAHFLQRWLEHVSHHKLLIVDGDLFRADPPSVMRTIQEFLRLKPIDYAGFLKYDAEKGFFCMVDREGGRKRKCLGRSKGRKYQEMSDSAAAFLSKVFREDNRVLRQMITRMGWNHMLRARWLP